MSNQYTLKISPEKAKEMPMVDLAFEVLKAANNPFYYRDLMQEIAKIKGISDDQVMEVIAQLYTEINIDGRFACVGSNLWGLKRWYPVDKGEDGAVGGSKFPRIINDDHDDEEDLDEIDPFEEDVDGYKSKDDDDEDSDDYYDKESEEDEDDLEEDLDDDLDEDEEIDEDLEDDEDFDEDDEEFDDEDGDDK